MWKSAQTRENTDQKKLRIVPRFTQCWIQTCMRQFNSIPTTKNNYLKSSNLIHFLFFGKMVEYLWSYFSPKFQYFITQNKKVRYGCVIIKLNLPVFIQQLTFRNVSTLPWIIHKNIFYGTIFSFWSKFYFTTQKTGSTILVMIIWNLEQIWFAKSNMELNIS